VAVSIRRIGWQQPIVGKRSGEVIAGITRLKAALHLGTLEVPLVWFAGNDLEATAFGIADNKTHEQEGQHGESLRAGQGQEGSL